MLGYAIVGIALAALFWQLSAAIEVLVASRTSVATRLGLHRSRGIVRLAGLFSLDAFAGGFVVQSMVAYWFHALWRRSGAIGAIFFGANILAAVSALSPRGSPAFGLINTMVFTHLPSNVLLILVPLMPTLRSRPSLLLARFRISQMDVPTRPVLHDGGRRPRRAVRGGRRDRDRPLLGAALAVIGRAAGRVRAGAAPFFIAGGLKIVYDLPLWRSFRRIWRPARTAGHAATVADGQEPGDRRALRGHGRRRPGIQTPPEERDPAEHDDDGDGHVERPQRVPDVRPARAEHRVPV